MGNLNVHDLVQLKSWNQHWSLHGNANTFFFFPLNLAVNVYLWQLWRNFHKQDPTEVQKPSSKHKRTWTTVWGLIKFFKDVIGIFKAHWQIR